MIKLFGAKLEVCEMIGLCLVSFGCFLRIYFKLIGWVIEGMVCAAAGGDQAFLVVVLSICL